MSTATSRSFLEPHRIALIVISIGIIALAIFTMRWDWLPRHIPKLIDGIGMTLWLLVVTSIAGFLLAVPIGFTQAAGPWWLAAPARAFCTIIRGTPLLLQLWMLYFGLGSLFVFWPEIRETWMWPYLRTAWPYGVLALTASFAGYSGEVMRGAFAGVPKGELAAARAFGMHPFKIFHRIWLPRAIHRALPTISGETVLQLKATPLVATITVVDVYAVISKVRQETFLTYEPLLLLALIYIILAGILTLAFRWLESRVPTRGT